MAPREMKGFMLDWMQRKVMLEPETSDALPEVLESPFPPATAGPKLP
ncbi:MAG: hypothetical protein ACQERF_03790 [Actinomycetota bacterium]